MSFSADGNKLAWVGHDSSISVADATRDMATHKLKTQVCCDLTTFSIQIKQICFNFCGSFIQISVIHMKIDY